MKIAVLVNRFPSLSETFVLDQIRELRKRGHDVDVFARRSASEPARHDHVPDELIGRTEYIEQLPASRLVRVLSGLWLMLRGLFQWPVVVLRSVNVFQYGLSIFSNGPLFQAVPFLRRGPYDLVHCHFGPQGLLANKLRQLGAFSSPIVVSFHGYDLHSFVLEHESDVYDDLFEEGEAFTANTAYSANVLRLLGCPEDRLHIVPEGLDPELFEPPEEYHRKPEQPSSGGRLLSVARLIENKGISFALRAVRLLTEKGWDLHYRIAGDGPKREALEKEVEEFGLTSHVTFLGWQTQEEVRALYHQSDVFVLPSVTAANGDQEGQALVLQEAQLCEVPVVSTLMNGIPEGVKEGETGFLVPEKDVRGLADRIETLLANPERRKEMGRNGRVFVLGKYRIDRVVDRLESVFASVCQVASS